jgi:hypothetical protein
MLIQLADMTREEVLVLENAVMVNRQPGHVSVVPDEWLQKATRLVTIGLIHKPFPVVAQGLPAHGFSGVIPTSREIRLFEREQADRIHMGSS